MLDLACDDNSGTSDRQTGSGCLVTMVLQREHGIQSLVDFRIAVALGEHIDWPTMVACPNEFAPRAWLYKPSHVPSYA